MGLCKLYTLDETGKPKPEHNQCVWAQWMEDSNNILLGNDDFGPRGQVRTIFTGQDLRWKKKGPAFLFETQVIGGPYDQQRAWHVSRELALSGHVAMVKLVLGEL